MPTCELVTIGSELLNGSVLNTNAQFLSRQVTDLHIDVIHQSSCRDREEEILGTLSLAFKRADLIVVTGGLGPTPDDITREAIAKFFRCGLKFDQHQYRHIVYHFRVRRRMPPFMTRREAYLPEVAKPLLNRFGIALGFYVSKNGRLLIALPGVPIELERMFKAKVKKLILQTFKNRPRFYTLEARTSGLYETQIIKKLGSSFFKARTFEFGIYPELGEVAIRIKARDRRLIAVLRRELAEKLGDAVYSFKGKTLSDLIGEKLTVQKKTLACAESCTGGLLARHITDPPGASRYFQGSLVAYSNQLKVNHLGVPKALIKQCGAVSPEVARAMAKAVRLKYDTAIGISVTGIAGPAGGTKRKPAGLVYIGISDLRKNNVFRFRFLGDRQKVRVQAARKALFLLWQWLQKR
ncbi:MAG: competence/damage-inducible protein A [Candidatus Omnitrophica bacterium]|nr:competence/damage-inducible protein A [Candidatus Omnitrophota bacterium]